MEEHVPVVRGAGVDAGDREFKRAGINDAGQGEVVADLQAAFFRGETPDDGGVAVFEPGLVFGLGDVEVRAKDRQLLRIDGELSKLHLLVPFELAAEPGEGGDGFDARNPLDDLPLARGQKIGDGDFAADDDTQCGPDVLGRDRHLAQGDLKGDEQEQADGDAQDGERRAPLVAQGVFGDEARGGHGADCRFRIADCRLGRREHAVFREAARMAVSSPASWWRGVRRFGSTSP